MIADIVRALAERGGNEQPRSYGVDPFMRISDLTAILSPGVPAIRPG